MPDNDGLFSPDEIDDNNLDDYVTEVATKYGKTADQLTVDELSKHLAHANRHIDKIEEENSHFRNERNSTQSLEEILKEIKALKNAPPQTTNPPTNAGERSGEKGNLTVDDLKRYLQEEKTNDLHQRNLAQVKEELVKTWGRDYARKLKEVGDDLGLTEDEMGEMAAKKPKMFLKAIGAEAKPAGPLGLAPSSSIRPSSSGKTRNFAYYNQLRRDNPQAYWDPKTRNEMFEMREKLGDQFYK